MTSAPTTRFRLELELAPVDLADMAQVHNGVRLYVAGTMTQVGWTLRDDVTRADIERLAKASGGQPRMALDPEGDRRLVVTDEGGEANLDYVVAFLQVMQRRLEVDVPWSFTYGTVTPDDNFGGGLIAVRGERVIRQELDDLERAAELALRLPSPVLAIEDTHYAGLADKAAARVDHGRAIEATRAVLYPFALAGGPHFLREAQEYLEGFAGARVSAVSLSVADLACEQGEIPMGQAHIAIREAAAHPNNDFEVASQVLLNAAQSNFPFQCFVSPDETPDATAIDATVAP